MGFIGLPDRPLHSFSRCPAVTSLLCSEYFHCAGAISLWSGKGAQCKTMFEVPKFSQGERRASLECTGQQHSKSSIRGDACGNDARWRVDHPRNPSHMHSIICCRDVNGAVVKIPIPNASKSMGGSVSHADLQNVVPTYSQNGQIARAGFSLSIWTQGKLERAIFRSRC